jgi:bifunctional DNA-binding transcriptional regulator/antitoxin component of YhaV-PrlF toxin-antitoxin module
MAQTKRRQVDARMDERGRVVIPAPIRRQLDVNGQAADVRLLVEVLDDE